MSNQNFAATTKSKTKVKGRKPVAVATLVILGWLMLGGVAGPIFGKISNVQQNDNAAFLPSSAESTKVSKITVKFNDQANNAIPTLLLAVGDINPASNPKAFAAFNQFAATLGQKILPESKLPIQNYLIAGAPLQAIPAPDGQAALVSIQLNSEIATQNIEDKPALPILIKFIREELKKTMDSVGLESHVTGAGGLFGDLFDAFGSIDTTLLKTTLLVVTVILIFVYRSPILWILPLFTAGSALAFATMIVYYLAKSGTIDLNGQTQGILDVLVLGAATDYALLLISRYREELHNHESRIESMKIAWRGTVEPIVASGSTVIAGLLVLLLSDLSGNRGLGPVGAIGIASAMFAVLTLLPALLVIFGRWIFWPKVPKFDHEDEKLSGIWAKVSNLVDRRPKQLVAITGIGLLAMVAFVPTLKANGLAQTESFTTKSDSVIGLDKLGKHFPSGEGSPVEILVSQSDAQAVSAAVSKVSEVASVVTLTKSDPVTKRPTAEVNVVDGKVLLNATLKVTADSQEGRNSIPKIREAAKSVSKEAMVGGQSAIFYDTDESSRRDNRLIIPIVLLLIGIILGLLLRSLVAAAVLLFTVVLSFAATLGVCALVFNHVFKFAGADTSFPLFTFVFLVALGIDYNIFLMTRVREESKRMGTRAGVLKGVTVTGGVITSAGVVLASTFGVLGLLPLVFLAELGFAVAFGVLLDTIIVRSLLVPSIVRLLGPKIWWPSELARGRE